MTARRAAASAAVALAVVLVVMGHEASAASQTFKCIVGGRTVYQQQACPVNADLPPVPGAAASSTAKVAGAASAAPASRKLKPASRPASSVLATPR